jgi:hypothetical protein
MNVPSVLLWGLAATIVLSITMAASQRLGYTRMSIPFLLGTMLTPNRDRAMLLGLVVHMMNGWLFAVVYALVFESWGRASWWLGAGIGLVHGLFVLTVGMPSVPAMHPRMVSEYFGPTPNRQLQPPGFLALNYGRRTPIVTLLSHLAYGAILGAFYRLAEP